MELQFRWVSEATGRALCARFHVQQSMSITVTHIYDSIKVKHTLATIKISRKWLYSHIMYQLCIKHVWRFIAGPGTAGLYL